MCCDVDPELEANLSRVPDNNPWLVLDRVDHLVNVLASRLPPVTWMIRSDDSVRFAVGDFDSGYVSKRALWQHLAAAGHELGWHMHLLSYDDRDGCYSFEPEPAWLEQALRALQAHFRVQSTRTGWDYCSNWLVSRLDQLGVRVDLSALPGMIAWYKAGKKPIKVNWSRAPIRPYHPHADDYQRAGKLRLLEVPITSFSNSLVGRAKRIAWRMAHASLSVRGVGSKYRMLTEPWTTPPRIASDILAFYFHPSELDDSGIRNFGTNIEMLRRLRDAEFVTASALN